MSVARDGSVPLQGTLGVLIDAVYVATLPTPLSLRFGSGQLWDVEQGKSYEPCPSERNGIFAANPAGGGTSTLMISIEEGA